MVKALKRDYVPKDSHPFTAEQLFGMAREIAADHKRCPVCDKPEKETVSIESHVALIHLQTVVDRLYAQVSP